MNATPQRLAVWNACRRMLLLLLAAALCSCSSSRGKRDYVDRHLNETGALAAHAYRAGSLDDAARLYGEMLSRARVLDDSAAIGNALYNLALCDFAAGRYPEARQRAREARGALIEAGRPAGETWVIEARAAFEGGEGGAADAILDEALTALPRPVDRRLLCELHLVRLERACEAGDVKAAGTAWDRVMESYSEQHPVGLRARVARGSGEVLALEEKPATAALKFDEETELLRLARDYREMASALVRAGGAYERAATPAPAADRYFRAGRSMLGQGNAEGAVKMAEKAVAAAAEAEDTALRDRAEQLLAESRDSARRSAAGDE